MSRSNAIHTCSYQCERPACIRAQRDELAERLVEVEARDTLLRSTLSALRDLEIGYSFRELHMDIPSMIAEGKRLGIELDSEDNLRRAFKPT